MRRAVIASGILLALSSVLAPGDVQGVRRLGTTYIVRPDSTGDFVTIQAAVDVATDGDTILVDPGDYGENVSVPFKDLVIRSSAGPDSTTTTSVTLDVLGLVLEGFAIDSTIQGNGDDEGVTFRNLVVEGEVNLEVEGLEPRTRWDPESLPPLETLRVLGNGLDVLGCTFRSDVTLSTFGEAVLAVESCELIDATLDADAMFWVCFVDSCSVTGGTLLAEGDAGAWIRSTQALNAELRVWSSGPFPALARGNLVDGGLIGVMGVEDVEARDNSVVGDITLYGGDLSPATVSGNHVSGTLHVDGGDLSVQGNTVTALDASAEMANDVADNIVLGGTLLVSVDPSGGSGTIDVTGNTVVGSSGEGIVIDADLDEATVSLVANLVVECAVGVVLPEGADTSSVITSCNDVWASSGPNWQGLSDPTGTDGNISADPLFCDAANADYRLSSNSPCLFGTCQQMGALGQGCVGPLPRIADISDVLNDQGGRVRLRWIRSGYDAAGDSIDIIGYGVYRLHEVGASSRSAGTAPPPDVRRDHVVIIDGWDYLATVPARGDSVYQYVAPTLCDSTVTHGMCWSVFFVSGMTPDPLVFFDSVPDSGYSVDNLAPAAPGDFIWIAEADSVHLNWTPVSDPDFAYYTVYGSETPEIGEATPIDHTVATTLTIPIDEFLLPYYFVSATDFAGNEGAPTGLTQPVGTEDLRTTPVAYRLQPVSPNPAGFRATVRFDLPEAAVVSIRVFDPLGRLVTTLASGHWGAGRHEIPWVTRSGGGRVPSAGVYFVRLDTPRYRETRQVVLIR